MSNYNRKLPLYDNLAQELLNRIQKNNIVMTQEYITKIKKVLNSLNPEQATQVALLLIHYYFLNNQTNPFVSVEIERIIPYGIRTNQSGKGFSFDFLNGLPVQLQALLGIYCGL